jgi:hypothetical protein
VTRISGLAAEKLEATDFHAKTSVESHRGSRRPAPRMTRPISQTSLPAENLAGERPLFVVGVYRSGTSLLYSVLNRHPEISLMYEAHLMVLSSLFSGQRTLGDQLARLEMFCQAPSRHRLTSGHKSGAPAPMETMNDVYRLYAAKKSASVYGEKSPAYSDRLPELVKAHPQCSIILIWRDPVEVYDSFLRAAETSPFFRRVGMLDRLIHGYEAMAHDSQRLENEGARIFHLDYRDLVDHTETSSRQICDFLGLAFSPSMLQLRDADYSAVFPHEQHDHLRSGEIIRQNKTSRVPRKIAARLRRYENRWLAIRGRPLPIDAETPRAFERVVHSLRGYVHAEFDRAAGYGFTCLPMTWLAKYREVKAWLRGDFDATPALPSLARMREEWTTISVAATLITITVGLQSFFGSVL